MKTTNERCTEKTVSSPGLENFLTVRKQCLAQVLAGALTKGFRGVEIAGSPLLDRRLFVLSKNPFMRRRGLSPDNSEHNWVFIYDILDSLQC